MAKIVADRVLETTTTTGTGALTLAGAVTGYRAFSSVCANLDTCDYFAEAINGSGVPTGNWEAGLGTWGTGGVLTRTTVYTSSNANALVSFAAGTTRVGLGLTSTAVNALLTADTTNTTSLATVAATIVSNESLPAISKTLHYGAVVKSIIYDTLKDSDAGAWRKRCVDKSWYNETICTGTWRSQLANLTAAWAVSGAAVGDFYQNTTDGKYYTIGGTSGSPTQTEVFRGNVREFPEQVAVMAESSRVIIYDLTQPSCPMWFVFRLSVHFWDGVPTSLSMLNGKLSLGSYNTANPLWSGNGLYIYDFITTSLSPCVIGGSGSYYVGKTYNFTSTIGIRSGYINNFQEYNIVNKLVNDVAMIVLDGAPIDPATGLPVPTIAVATAGGVSVIKSDGSVVNSASTLAFGSLSIIPASNPMLIATCSGQETSYLYDNLIGLMASFTQKRNLNSLTAPYNKTVGQAQIRSIGTGRNRFGSASLDGPYALTFTVENSGNTGLAAFVNNTYNTGWQVGDARGTYLADTVAETIAASGELITNGTFDTVDPLVSGVYNASSYVRDTPAYVTLYDGVQVAVPSGMTRHTGGRLIRNLVSSDITTWSKQGGVVVTADSHAPPTGLVGQVYKVVSDAIAHGVYITSLVGAGTVITESVWLCTDTTLAMTLGTAQGSGAAANITLSSTWNKYSVNGTSTIANDGPNIYTASGAGTFYVFQPQFEVVTGFSNQNPSEYVPQFVTTAVTSNQLILNGTNPSATTSWASSSLYTSTMAAVSSEFQVTNTTTYGRQLQTLICVVGQTYILSGYCRVVSGTAQATIGVSAGIYGQSMTQSIQTAGTTNVYGSALFVASATTMYIVIGDNLGTSSTAVTAYNNISCVQYFPPASNIVLGPEMWSNPAPSVSVSGTGDAGNYNTSTKTFTITATGSNNSYPRFGFSLGLVTGIAYTVFGVLTGASVLSSVVTVRLATSGGANSIIYNSTTGVFAGTIIAGATPYLELDFTGLATSSIQIVTLSVKQCLYQGAGADGYMYSYNQNGNTVASNIVTNVTGALITNSVSNCADAKGPFGYLAEGPSTQYLGVTSAPASQTTSTLAPGTYTLWMTGSGSVSLS